MPPDSSPGSGWVAYVEDGRVVLDEWQHLLRRAQSRVATQTAAHQGSAVDELIADRRAEAARDDRSPDATVAGTPGEDARGPGGAGMSEWLSFCPAR